MKIKWLLANVTPVVSPDRAEHDIFEIMLDVWPIQVAFVAAEGATV